MTISRSSVLCINVLLIFEMHDLNGAAKRSIVPSTTIYASL